jgi:hypothetical protein
MHVRSSPLSLFTCKKAVEMKHVRTAGSENFCRSRGLVYNIKDTSQEVFVKFQRETKQVSSPDFMFHFCHICVSSGID